MALGFRLSHTGSVTASAISARLTSEWKLSRDRAARLIKRGSRDADEAEAQAQPRAPAQGRTPLAAQRLRWKRYGQRQAPTECSAKTFRRRASSAVHEDGKWPDWLLAIPGHREWCDSIQIRRSRTQDPNLNPNLVFFCLMSAAQARFKCGYRRNSNRTLPASKYYMEWTSEQPRYLAFHSVKSSMLITRRTIPARVGDLAYNHGYAQIYGLIRNFGPTVWPTIKNCLEHDERVFAKYGVT